MLHTTSVGAAEGPPTLLLHGFLGSGRNLHSLARRWAEARPARRFLLVDLPGHGTSPPVAPGDDLDALGAAVLETARAAGPGPYRLVGHSHGGRVALAAARRAPGELAGVTLLDIAPGPVRRDPGIAAVVAALLAAPARAADRAAMREPLLAAGLARPLADWLLMNLVPDAAGGVTWRIDREALEAGHRRWGAEDLWDAVEDPRTPVHACIRGETSGFVDAADRDRLEAAGVRVHSLAGAGHFVHVDAPGPLLELLLGG